MIREFITSHLKSKLKEYSSLVIYDKDELYQELLPLLVDNHTKVFDIRESVLSVREDAMEYFMTVIPAEPNAKMILYVPYPAPEDKEDKVHDPFIIFSIGGTYFPNSAMDKYESLCKSCLQDKETQIDQLFKQEIPDFDTIDALGGGSTWAKLQTLTGGKSEREILLGLLNPSSQQKDALVKDKVWIKEWKDFIGQMGLVSKEKSFEAINDELWRFILFSEFVFDLPISLPSSLKSIAIAKPNYKVLVFDICNSLRNNKACQDSYIEKAALIESQLSLSSIFKDEHNLGEIITFSFEDYTYFHQFVELLESGEIKQSTHILKNSKNNIWVYHDPERLKYWKLAEFAQDFLEIVNTKRPLMKSITGIINHYADIAYKADQFQRKFEKNYLEILEQSSAVTRLVKLFRTSYRDYSENIQKEYQALFANQLWPIEGMMSNINVFNKVIQPLLKAKKRTAYILVDALRFELGKELADQISKHFEVEIKPSCAYLPTVTKFGMAALLPEAESLLQLQIHDESLESFMGEKPLLNLTHRKEYLKNKLGDRCEILKLEQLVTLTVIPDVELLIITTNEIDNAGENLESTALTAMDQALRNLVKSLYILRTNGYEKIVIATDHGFVIHPEFQMGDNVKKPAGDWVLSKSRCLAGKGAAPGHTLHLTPNQIGVKSEVQDFVFLKNYAVFEKNTTYFHEGISLQENIVPVIILTNLKSKKEKKIEVTITYKGKSSGIITTRRPLLEVSSYVEGDLGLEAINIRIEALADTQTVGLPALDEKTNEITRLVEILPGQSSRIPLEMNEDFEGKFEVRITDPLTNKTLATINLETDYIS